MAIRALEPTNFPFFDYKRYSFSLGLEAPEGIWLSGHSASRFAADHGDVVVTGDIVAQSRVAYEKIAAILAAAGLSLRDVVRTVDYVTVDGIADYPGTAALRRDLFGPQPPVTSTVVVKRLLRPTALIEIEVVASRGGSTPIDDGAPVDALHRATARRVGDLVYLAAQLPLRPGTAVVAAPGNIAGQMRQIYQNAGQLLRAAGLGWDNVVKTVEFLTPAGLPRYKETAGVRREFLAPRYPAATGIIMPRLANPEALVQIDFIASRQPLAVINPGWAHYDKLTYSPAIKAGNLLFFAGHGAINPETNASEHPGDIVAQTRYVYSSLMEVLRAAGAGPEAMVKTVEFLTAAALPRYRETADVRREFFRQPYPTATGIVCEQLVRPEMLIEVDAVAVLP